MFAYDRGPSDEEKRKMKAERKLKEKRAKEKIAFDKARKKRKKK